MEDILILQIFQTSTCF